MASFFVFLTYKNYNVGVEADVLIAKTFLFNIFLAIFVFLIAKIIICLQII